MPEFPEVETTRRGIAPHLVGRRIGAVTLRRPDLRWPIPAEVAQLLPGQVIESVERRAKYLLLRTEIGSALLHLGMSGMLRVLPPDAPLGAHDHVDIGIEAEAGKGERVLRFTDPRRFGCLLWQWPGETHPLLASLGPEPLTEAFDGDLLWHTSRGRKAAVKLFLMDNAVVVGVGNIYASEALFAAGIDPRKPAGKISRARYARLADRSEAHPGLGDRARRHHLARLPQSRWRARLFLPRAQRLRPHRRTLPHLRHADPPGHAGAALDVLVPDLPTLIAWHRPLCQPH